MAITPLHEIIEKVELSKSHFDTSERGIHADVDIDELRKLGQVAALNNPNLSDYYSDQTRLPIYSIDEMKDSPYNGQGLIIETLAWYTSFHYSHSGWGIYILRSGLYKVANALIDGGFPQGEAIEMAQKILLRHEQAHFQTELAITSLEFATDAQFYVDARRKMQLQNPGWHETEEGFANALARRIISKAPRNAFDGFLNSSPTGYRDWSRYRSTEDPQTWKLVIDELLQFEPRLFGSTEFAAEIGNTLAPKYFDDIPVYEVYDLPDGDINEAYFVGPISVIQETETFTADMNNLAKGQPIYKKKWEGVKIKLAAGNVVGVHLERINKEKSLYSVRIDGEARAGLNREFSTWRAIAAGHHDELYRRLSR